MYNCLNKSRNNNKITYIKKTFFIYFTHNQKALKTITKFVRGIYTHYTTVKKVHFMTFKIYRANTQTHGGTQIVTFE